MMKIAISGYGYLGCGVECAGDSGKRSCKLDSHGGCTHSLRQCNRRLIPDCFR